MPLGKQIHRNRPLENISIAYKPGEFIADKFVGTVPVKKNSDEYYIYSTDIMSLPETLRAPGTRANRADFSMSFSTYSLERHALSQVIPDSEKENADKPIQLEIDMTEILTRKILIRKEIACASVAQDSSNWSNSMSLSAGAAWTQNTVASNPITLIDSCSSVILKNSGYTPNKLQIDDGGFRALKVHTSIVDRVKYTSADSITEQMLAKLFSLQEVLVGKATYETAAEGLASSMGWIWTNNALLAYMEPNPGLKKPSAMYQFVKSNGGSKVTVKKWREEAVDGDWVEVDTSFQFKPVATSCGYLLIDIT